MRCKKASPLNMVNLVSVWICLQHIKESWGGDGFYCSTNQIKVEQNLIDSFCESVNIIACYNIIEVVQTCFKIIMSISKLLLSNPELQKHKYPSILEHLWRIPTVFARSLITLTIRKFPQSTLFPSCFLISRVPLIHIIHSGCLAAAYLRISSLRLTCGCLLENFLMEAALWLVAWKFPLEGYLFNWNFILEDTLLKVHDCEGMFEAYLENHPLLGYRVTQKNVYLFLGFQGEHRCLQNS